MCLISSTRESQLSPQPTNRQMLEKKEAAMAVMFAAALQSVDSGGEQKETSQTDRQAAVSRKGAARQR